MQKNAVVGLEIYYGLCLCKNAGGRRAWKGVGKKEKKASAGRTSCLEYMYHGMNMHRTSLLKFYSKGNWEP